MNYWIDELHPTFKSLYYEVYFKESGKYLIFLNSSIYSANLIIMLGIITNQIVLLILLMIYFIR